MDDVPHTRPPCDVETHWCDYMPVAPVSQAERRTWSSHRRSVRDARSTRVPPRCAAAPGHGPLRRGRRCPVPAGSAAAGRPHRQRHRGDRGRQHRGRHLGARAEGLPRPRHRDVHPRRRHRHRAWLGPARGDLARQGRARGVRRRADLVRARRPRPRHPPGAHADARRRVPALRRSPRRCASAGGRVGPSASDDRRPHRDPRRGRRPRGATAGRSTSRSTGCATAPTSPRPRSW